MAIGLALTATCATAQTVLIYKDEATGHTSVNTDQEYHMRFQGNRQGIGLTVEHNSSYEGPRQGGLEYLYVTLGAPAGETWRKGLYTDVSCNGLAMGRSASMSVTTDNPICYEVDWLWGWISIRQIEFDSAGQITKLDVMFNQRLGSETTPGKIMTLRHNAMPQSFSVTTGKRSPFGARQHTFFGDEADFFVSGNAQSLAFVAEATKQQWYVGVTPPEGQQITKGRYPTSTGDVGPGRWRMELAFLPEFLNDPKAVWCSGDGVLDIKDVAYDGSGALTAVHATFQHACNANRGAVYKDQTGVDGEIRFNR